LWIPHPACGTLVSCGYRSSGTCRMSCSVFMGKKKTKKTSSCIVQKNLRPHSTFCSLPRHRRGNKGSGPVVAHPAGASSAIRHVPLQSQVGTYSSSSAALPSHCILPRLRYCVLPRTSRVSFHAFVHLRSSVASDCFVFASNQVL
jgi:hypothetical protein